MATQWLIALGTVVLIIARISGKDCDINKCFSNRIHGERFVGPGTMSAKKLDKACRKLYETEQCFAKMQPKCSDEVRNSMDAYLAGQNYICDNRADFVSALKCLGKHKLGLDKCVRKSMKQHTQYLTQSDKKEPAKMALCEFVDSTEECIDKIEDRHCGRRSAEVMRKYFSLVNKAMQKGLECVDIDPETEELGFEYNCYVVIGLSVGGGVLFIVLIVTTILCCRCYRKRRSNKDENIKVDQFPSNLTFVLETDEKIATITKDDKKF